MKRIAEYVLLVMLTAFLTVKGIVPAWTSVHSDFANYYVSSRLVAEGVPLDSLYDKAWFQEKTRAYGIETNGKFSPFPPLTAWMMLPLTPFEPIVAQQIFTVINLIFMALGIFFLKQLTHWQMTSCALFILGGGLSLVNNFAFGQIYWIITVFVLYAVLLHQKNKPVFAGIIVGIFTALKYFPVVFIAGYFLNGWLTKRQSQDYDGSILSSSSSKLVVSSLLTIAVLGFLQFIFFGNSLMSQFIHSIFIPHLDGQLAGQGLYSFHYQSWDNLFRNLFVRDPEFNPAPFLNWPFGKTVLKVWVMLFVLGTMLLVFIRYKSAKENVRTPVFLSLPALAAFVILPASATYHFVMLIIPLGILLGSGLLERKYEIVVVFLFSLIGFIPYGLAFQWGKSWGLLFAYPRLWLISILYLVVVWGLIKKKELNFAS